MDQLSGATQENPILAGHWASGARDIARPAKGRLSPGLLLLIACVVLPTLLMALGARLAWRDIWHDTVMELEHGAEGVAEYGQRVLTLHAVAAGRMNAILRGLSDAEIVAREPELHAEFRRLVEEIPQTQAGFVLDRHGTVLVSANVFPVPRHDASGADRDFFRALSAADAPQVHVSEVHTGRLDGSLFFAVSRRRERTGNADLPLGSFDGLVNLSVPTAELSAALRRFHEGPGDIARLIRTDGAVLARSEGLAAPVWLQGSFAERTRGMPPRAFFEGAAQTDGVQRLYALRLIDGWPVYAVAARPRAAVVAAWREVVLRQLAVGLPPTLALIGLAFLVCRRERRLGADNAGLEAHVAARTAELAESEARLRGALEAGRVYAVDYDPASDCLFRSPNAAAILGLSSEAADAQPFRAFLAAVHPDDVGHLRASLAAVTPESPHYAVRFRYRRPDGTTVWLQGEGAARFRPDGRLLRVTSLARDVTAEVEAAQAASTFEQRLSIATAGAGVGSYEIDLARGLAWFDARAAQVLGGVLPAEAWIRLDGREWAALDASIHPDDHGAFQAAWDAVVSGEASGWSLETRLRRQDGSWVSDWCHGVVTERDPATGKACRVVGILQDVTERRQLEAELRQAQKMQALGMLAGGIAHDFNNVLQAISGSAALALRDAADPPAVDRRLRAVAEAVARGASITHRLLEFSRRSELRRDLLEPGAVLHGLREILATGLGTRIEIRLEVEPGLPPVLADRAQLQTALINLAGNARDAMPSGGLLTLSAVAAHVGASARPSASPDLPRGDYVCLGVHDTGTGMDAATLARVAQPFFTTKPPGAGTGLGLAMAKGLAKQHGGALAIESAPGIGTTVTLWLPIRPQASAPPGSPIPANDMYPPPPAAVRAVRLLVVDDEPVVRETMAEELLVAGYAVVAAGGGEAALAMLDAGEAVDALVIDFAMPGLDGLALLGEARRRRPGLACVVVTGQADASGSLARGCMSLGACALIHKPATGAEIAASVDALLQAAGAG